MKVGIVQNRIIYGGRLAVIVGIVEILNRRGVVPDLITFQTEISSNGVYGQYNMQINFQIRRINSVLSKIPGEANILAFNLAIHRVCKLYDYFISSNNTSFLMPAQIPILSYIHFPRIARLKSPYASIHFPDGPLKRWHSRHDAIAKFLKILYSLDRIQRNTYVVANSRFSRSYFQHYYPAYKQHIPVIYPPVKKSNNFISPFNERANIVCSIGRFCQEKNQLGQIRIAERLPGWKFILIGFADERNTYLKECESYVNKKRIKNVKLEVNVPETRKREILKVAKFFLHPNINEPFGISSAESILYGCLPLVHDSGGQREIVPFADLRFKVLSDIPRMFEKFSKCNDHLSRLQKQLLDHCRDRFDMQFFKEKMDAQINHFESLNGLSSASSLIR